MSLQDTVGHAVRGFVQKAAAQRHRLFDLRAVRPCGADPCDRRGGDGADPAGRRRVRPVDRGRRFSLVIVVTMFWLQRPAALASRPAAMPVGAAAEAATRSQAQFAQIAMIIEAVMLGYSMSRRR